MLVGAGLLYLIIVGPRLVPVRRSVTNAGSELPMEYVTEVLITPESPFLGQTLDDAIRRPHPEIVVNRDRAR